MIFHKLFIVRPALDNNNMDILTNKSKEKKLESGYITLLSVLIVGALGLSVTTSLLLSGLSSSRNSLAVVQASYAKSMVNACAEEALERIRENISFTGTNNMTFTLGTCTYTVTNTGGESRTIATSSTVGTIVKKLNITIDDINPRINISSWQEVADF